MTLKLGHTVSDEKDNYAGLYLPEEDRSTHLYVLGSSGVGKSKALLTIYYISCPEKSRLFIFESLF